MAVARNPGDPWDNLSRGRGLIETALPSPRCRHPILGIADLRPSSSSRKVSLRPIPNGVRILDSSSLVPRATPAGPARPFPTPTRQVRSATRSHPLDRSPAGTGCAYRSYTGPAKKLASLPAQAADAANGAIWRTLGPRAKPELLHARNGRRCPDVGRTVATCSRRVNVYSLGGFQRSAS